MPKTPRTDDLLQSHPGEPYTYLTPLARVEEKDLQGSIPVGSVSLADLIIGADGTFIKTVGAAAVWTLITAADITSGNLAYARLPTGGGTWANGGALSITGGITTVAGLSSTANVAVSTAGGSDGLSLSRPVATPGGINFATSGSNRWGIYVTEAAESGSDAGSNFRIRARTDAGAFLDDPITVVRAAGGAIALGSAGGRSVVVGVDPGGSELVRIGGAVRAGDVVKTTGSNAKQSFMSKPQLGFRNQFEVHQLLQRSVMRRAHIFDDDLLCAQGIREFDALDGVLIETSFNSLASLRSTGAAVIGLELETVEARRIMARRNHHTTNGLLLFNCK